MCWRILYLLFVHACVLPRRALALRILYYICARHEIESNIATTRHIADYAVELIIKNDQQAIRAQQRIKYIYIELSFSSTHTLLGLRFLAI